MGVGCGPNHVGNIAYLEYAEYLELIHVHDAIRRDYYRTKYGDLLINSGKWIVKFARLGLLRLATRKDTVWGKASVSELCPKFRTFHEQRPPAGGQILGSLHRLTSGGETSWSGSDAPSVRT